MVVLIAAKGATSMAVAQATIKPCCAFAWRYFRGKSQCALIAYTESGLT